MQPLKNLAGHAVSVFLFRFDLSGTCMSFVVNEGIAADMFPDVDMRLQPLVAACSETLLRYRDRRTGDTMLDGSILTSGEGEVMLSPGLGQHLLAEEKQRLLRDAAAIATLLVEVMERSSQEQKEGKPARPPYRPQPSHREPLNAGLEALGQVNHLQAELQGLLEGQRPRPGVNPLRPDDLPQGVTAVRGYDHRGHCYQFSHATLGELGKIVVLTGQDGRTLLHADLFTGAETEDARLVQQKRQLFEQVVTIITTHFDQQFPPKR